MWNELHSYFYTKNKPVTGQVKQTLKIIKHNTLNTERTINYCLIATLLKQLQYKKTQNSFPNETIQGWRFWPFCRLQKGTKKINKIKLGAFPGLRGYKRGSQSNTNLLMFLTHGNPFLILKVAYFKTYWGSS